jgi:hypothetical protein
MPTMQWMCARRPASVVAVLLALAFSLSVAPAAEAGPAPVPRLTIGMGPEADGALRSKLTREAPVSMLTSWYNGPEDLSWMSGWRKDLVPKAYAAGRPMHLVIWTNDRERALATAYGPACGRGYPLSAQYPSDMRQLAQTFAGKADGPPLYVTVFSEFQTYPCSDNAWSATPGATHYYQALRDRYRQTVQIFRTYAPNAKLSLGWGGWQARWDNPRTGGGRSLLPHFAKEMRASDFQSFQAMASDTNVADIRAMTALLAPYGPVMLAHYKPDNRSQATFDTDVRRLFTDASLSSLTRSGLFAMSFMDDKNVIASPTTYAFLRDRVRRYGKPLGQR